MAEIIRAYRQDMGATRFIGKRYGDGDRVDGMFGALWGEWYENGWFGAIEEQLGASSEEAFEDAGAHIGLMREDESGGIEYWIGCFTPEGATVPEGYQYVDFARGDLGVCWVCGKESDVFMNEGACVERLAQEGFEISGEWCFERYACPRFTTPDDKGNVILDICFFMK